MQTHFKYIDRLKGFAIFSVVMGHFIIYGLNKMGLLFEVIGSYHMPLFMFLSGIVASVPNIRKVIAKTFLYMLPLLTIGSLFMFVFGINFGDFICSPFKGGYWYLYVLSLFLFPLFLVNRLSKNWRVQVLIALLLYALFYILSQLVEKEWNDTFSIWMMKQYWPFFIIGHFIRNFNISTKLFESNLIYTIALVLYLVSFFFWYNGMAVLNYIVSLSFIMVVSCFMFIREKCSSFIERQMECLGTKTLDIYIYHYFFIKITHFAVLGDWLDKTDNILLELIMGVVYSIIVIYLSIGVGKIIRYSDVLRNIVYGDFANKIIISNHKISENHF